MKAYTKTLRLSSDPSHKRLTITNDTLSNKTILILEWWIAGSTEYAEIKSRGFKAVIIFFWVKLLWSLIPSYVK